MKAWIAAAALAGLAGCLENPGVDQGLATKHDRLSGEFRAGGIDSFRVRLYRSGGETRLYLSNAGFTTIDTLEFFLQIARYGLPNLVDGSDMGSAYDYPMLIPDPIVERHLRIAGLPAGKEIDLGALSAAFPDRIDGLAMIFYPLRIASGSRRSDAMSGLYAGRYSETDPHGKVRSGTLRGLVVYRALHFWLRPGDDLGSFRARLMGDSLVQAMYRSGWYADTVPRLAWTPSASDDSIHLQARLLPLYAPGPDTLEFRAALARMEPEAYEFPATPPQDPISPPPPVP